MQRTEFGKFTAKLRIDHGVTIAQMAKAADVSSAFVCAVESGKRSASQKLIDSIANIFELGEEERSQLVSLANEDRKRNRYSGMNSMEKSIMFYLPDIITKMPEAKKKKLLSLCEKGKLDLSSLI